MHKNNFYPVDLLRNSVICCFLLHAWGHVTHYVVRKSVYKLKNSKQTKMQVTVYLKPYTAPDIYFFNTV